LVWVLFAGLWLGWEDLVGFVVGGGGVRKIRGRGDGEC